MVLQVVTGQKYILSKPLTQAMFAASMFLELGIETSEFNKFSQMWTHNWRIINKYTDMKLKPYTYLYYSRNNIN